MLEIFWSVLLNMMFGGFTTLLGICVGRNFGKLDNYLKGYEAGSRDVMRSLEQVHYLTNNTGQNGLD